MWVQFLCRKCVIFIPLHVTLSTSSKSYSKSFSFHHLSQKIPQQFETFEKILLRIHPPNQGYLKAHSLYSNHFFRLVCDNNTKKESHCSLNVRCRCMSFISVFRRSTLLLCRVGVTTYDYDVPLWHNRILRIQDRNTTKREEGGRADS